MRGFLNQISCFRFTVIVVGLGLGGCASGDSGGPVDEGGAPSPDGGGSSPDATSPDGSLDSSAEDSSNPASHIDAGGGDSALADSGAAGEDASDDSSAPDSGSGVADSGGGGGGDGSIAESGSGTEAGGPEAGSDAGHSITNPLQVDVTSILTVDTVGGTATGGKTLIGSGGSLTSMDGSGYDFYTAALASQVGVSGGLPSNGFFAANGTQNPPVQLHFNDSSTAPNSVLLNGLPPNTATTLTFTVPSSAYNQVQMYGTSTEGASSLSITLTYSNSTMATSMVTIPDWGTGTATAPAFVLASGMGRFGTGTFEVNYVFALYGVNLNPDPTKSLLSVAVTHVGPGRFVFYGATAW
jgi:hypothetical protein